MTSAKFILRSARQRAGLSQVELARRAGVTQSVVSAYESGARQPSVPMLDRLVAAAGYRLEISAEPASIEGPLADRLLRHRMEVLEIAARRGLSNVCVFGSVARGDEQANSDIDLLADVSPGIGLFELGRCQAELEELLGSRVDLVPADGLKPEMRMLVTSEARPV